MNIFYLDKSPSRAAQAQCDKHVVKMVLETAQLLSSVQHILDGPVKDDVYRLTHKNHPCSVWARSSKTNYDWLCLHGFSLCHEYSHRYGKIHKSLKIIEKCFDNPPKFEHNDFTEPPQAMPEEYKKRCAVEAYRDYYRIEKANTIQMQWTKQDIPEWWLILMEIIVTVNSHKYGIETFRMTFEKGKGYRVIEADVAKVINAGYPVGDVISSSWKLVKKKIKK